MGEHGRPTEMKADEALALSDRLTQARLELVRLETPHQWLLYGHIDPVQQLKTLLQPCRCGEQPFIVREVRGHVVSCLTCSRHSRPARVRWQSVLAWNGCRHCLPWHWQRDTVFFGLRGMEPEDALAKLVHLADHLELRVKIARLEARLGFDEDSTMIGRLTAFHYWANLLLRKARQDLRGSRNRR